MATKSIKPPAKGPKQTVLRSLVSIRFADAEVLLKTKVHRRLNGAVYMAGYGIECALKARICADGGQRRLDAQFFHHDLRKLAEMTRKWADLPKGDTQRKTLDALQSEWDVDMRYGLAYRDAHMVRRFIARAKEFTRWLLSD